MKTPPDRTIQVGMLCARYWAGGGGGSPVVLIHGLGDSVETWLPSFEPLAFQHRLFAVDLPGHGRTDKPAQAPYDAPFFAGFVHAFLEALGLDQAHVVGHSLGGAVALRLARDYPAAVDRLVLVDSGGLGRQIAPVLRVISLPLVGELMTRPSLSATADTYRQMVYDPAVVPPELLERIYELSTLPRAQQSFLKTLRVNANLFGAKRSAYRPLVEWLPSWKKPVLLLWGRQDGVVPLAYGQDAARALPDARLEVFERCGHLPMLEHAEAFNERVLEFLAN